MNMNYIIVKIVFFIPVLGRKFFAESRKFFAGIWAGIKKIALKSIQNQRTALIILYLRDFLVTLLVFGSAVLVVARIFKISADKADSEVIAALAGVALSILAMAGTNFITGYFKARRLKTALLTEVGLIARALFKDMAKNHNTADKNIYETFDVNHAVIHSVGQDIALLDGKCAEDILEFHSLLKVLRNLCCQKDYKREQSYGVICEIAEIVSGQQLCKDIIRQNEEALKCCEEWKTRADKHFPDEESK